MHITMIQQIITMADSVISIFLAIILCAQATEILDEVIKSQHDPRNYRAIKLSNQIECLLISDETTKLSSAALSVAVGYFHDPPHKQGLSHFLQHLLMTNCQKYPEENSLLKFVASNSGKLNAMTKPTDTTYFIQISNIKFTEGLDRLASLIAKPMFSEELAQRELLAVHSQHMLELTNDSCRVRRVKKHLAKQGHPYRKYMTGNKQMLADSNQSRVLSQYFESHYSSNLMKLILYSNQTLEELQQHAQQIFSDIPNKNYSKFKLESGPYTKDSLGKLVKVIPVQDIRVLQLTWILPDQTSSYRNPPSSYVTFLLNSQGQGSLSSVLQGLGLIVDLRAHAADHQQCYSSLQVKMALTRKGVGNIKLILQHFLYYIQFLSKSAPQQQVYQQIKAYNRIQFTSSQPVYDLMYTYEVARKMHTTKLSHILNSNFLMSEWRPDLIKQYIDQLRLDNLIAVVQAKQFDPDCNLIQPILQVKYGVSQLIDLHPRSFPASFPTKNPFLPANFEQEALGNETTPTLVHQSEQLEVYFKKDHLFGSTKVIFNFRVYFEANFSSRLNVVRQIYLILLALKNRQNRYLAKMAGLSFDIQAYDFNSFIVSIKGFRDSALKFVMPVFQQLFEFEPSESQHFQEARDILRKLTGNDDNLNTLAEGYSLLQASISKGPTQLFVDQQIKNVRFEEVANFSRSWQQKVNVQAYITGNINQNQTNLLIDEIASFVKARSEAAVESQEKETQIMKIPQNVTWILEYELSDIHLKTSFIFVYFQWGEYTPRASVMHKFMSNLLWPSSFEYFRTKMQLGYIVDFFQKTFGKVLGIVLSIKSETKTSYELSQQISRYLQKILPSEIHELRESEFEQEKRSLRESLEQLTTLDQQAFEFSNQVFARSYQFDRRQKQIEEIDLISFTQFKEFLLSLLYTHSRKLQLHGMTANGAPSNRQAKLRKMKQDPHAKVYAKNQVTFFKEGQEYYSGPSKAKL